MWAILYIYKYTVARARVRAWSPPSRQQSQRRRQPMSASGGVPSPLPTEDVPQPDDDGAEHQRRKRDRTYYANACGALCLCLAGVSFALWLTGGEECAEPTGSESTIVTDDCYTVFEQNQLLTCVVVFAALGSVPLCLLCPAISRSRGATSSLGGRTVSNFVADPSRQQGSV